MGAVKLMKTRLIVMSITDMLRRRREPRADVGPARFDELISFNMMMIVQAIMAERERERERFSIGKLVSEQLTYQ